MLIIESLLILMKRNVLIIDNEGWPNGQWKKLEQQGKVEIIRNFPECSNAFSKLFFKLAVSHKLSRFGFNSLQRLFVRKAAQCLGLNHQDDISVLVYHIAGGFRYTKIIRALQAKYPNVKFGYVFTNVVSKGLGKDRGKIIDDLKKSFDVVYAFDKQDANQYHIEFSYLVYSSSGEEDVQTDCDVFLVAKAKDRFDKIVNLYQKCLNEKLKCDFYVNCLSQEQVRRSKELLLNQNIVLSYEDVVKKIHRTKCIVDIMQKGSTGVTLNVVEGICYNKKIISDNIHLKDEPFFDESRIYILGERTDSLKDFIISPIKAYTSEERKLFDGLNLFERLRKND